MTKVLVTSIILLTAICQSTYATEEPITVGIVYGADFTGSLADRIGDAIAYQNFANIALNNSLITDRSFDVSNLVLGSLSLNPVVTDKGDILTWMRTQNANPISALSVFHCCPVNFR